MKQFIKYFSIVLLIIIVDQASKLWVYTHMEMGTEGQINLLGNVFKLTYTLNPGMAFSIHLGFKYGKLLITMFRMLASLYIFWYIIQSIRKNASAAWIFGWALVLGGAIGNSIDSIFYGVYLNNAPVDAPMKWFYGQVIDMLHIDLWSGLMPSWLPIWGSYYVYCLPVFNIADVAVSAGLIVILCLFHSTDRTKD
ncbi:MAG: lipoprotein signal peptidase [Candidatus Cardinium sp.]|mgnify:CR=1 FL=1|uniref:lipoprotein signal peptidase n=1 Tax=Cardinium endosymbiont of Dermatophagoides farinae TaxID=2597823 RepID=UPI0011840D28|nr:lipoprotein signal peptidase [Cardinium endosymbiont of Dermatophagoides farinae]TSJ81284.1 lipoprotein signal peptidase [Cardinium endosymbiont of Dermatophagoides farinae]UWW97343.1 MAG: lipoprotein signal peptidase [Candidatus Cardinium sp.]